MTRQPRPTSGPATGSAAGSSAAASRSTASALTPSSLTPSSLTPSSLLMDFRLLLFLFIGFRLMLGMAFEPMLLESSGERGMTVGGDLYYHFHLAQLTENGDFPFREWWSEFPPVWSWMYSLIYQALGANANYTSWSIALTLVMLVCDVGNLWLMRAIGARLHGASTGMALAWIYALLLVPVVFMWWNFEVMVAFTLLLSLWWLVTGKDTHSALMAGFGALVKFTPALILGAVFRYRPLKHAVRYAVIALGLFLLVYGVLYITSPNRQMVTVSLVAQFGKASYQSVWALLDGNLTTGNFAAPGIDTVAIRYDPAAATTLYGNPPVVPGWLRMIGAGLIGLFVFVRTRRFDDKGLVAFVGITLLIFFLQAQGWSPQWLAQILPLILLTFPTRNGVLICVVLSGLIFAEYPFLFIRTGDSETPGIISGALLTPYVALIITRTLMLVAVAVAFYRKLRQEGV